MKVKIKWDHRKLEGKIKEMFDIQEAFAKEIGISATSLNYKLNNKSQFNQEEIYLSTLALKLEDDEIKPYFFTPLVEKTQQINIERR